MGNYSILPKIGDWELLKSWGFEVLGDHDDLFYEVRLPDGWKKTEAGRSRYSGLLDEQGRRRADIVPYDLSLSIRILEQRFGILKVYSDIDKNGLQFEVKDFSTDEVLFTGDRGHYAVLNLDVEEKAEGVERIKGHDGIIGFVMGDTFFCMAYMAYGRINDISFGSEFSASQCRIISDDEFYEKFHHVEECPYVIRAAEYVAKRSASIYAMAHCPNASNQWNK